MKSVASTEQAMLNYAKELGYWPSRSQWDKYARENGHMSFVGVYYHTRKGWEAYREQFGFPPREKVFTKDDCISALHQAAQELGQFFTRREYDEWQKKRPDLPSIGQFAGRCGTWNKAKEEAELFTNAAWGKEFDDNEIIQALKDCSAALGPLFSEAEYMAWNDGTRPHIETIRKRMGSLPEAKKAMELETYHQGKQTKYTDGRWQEPFLHFISDSLKSDRYFEWAKENGGPSNKALFDNAGGYEKALLEILPLYIEKVTAGRKKR